MKRYFNLKTQYGIETIDEINKSNFKDYQEFKTELRRLKNEYWLCGMSVYISSRSTKEWRENK